MKIEELIKSLQKFPGSRLEAIGMKGKKTIYRVHYKNKSYDDFKLYDIYQWLKSMKSSPDVKHDVIDEIKNDLTDDQINLLNLARNNVGRHVKISRHYTLTKSDFIQDISGIITETRGHIIFVLDGDRELFVSVKDIVHMKFKNL